MVSEAFNHSVAEGWLGGAESVEVAAGMDVEDELGSFIIT